MQNIESVCPCLTLTNTTQANSCELINYVFSLESLHGQYKHCLLPVLVMCTAHSLRVILLYETCARQKGIQLVY